MWEIGKLPDQSPTLAGTLSLLPGTKAPDSIVTCLVEFKVMMFAVSGIKYDKLLFFSSSFSPFSDFEFFSCPYILYSLLIFHLSEWRLSLFTMSTISRTKAFGVSQSQANSKFARECEYQWSERKERQRKLNSQTFISP